MDEIRFSMPDDIKYSEGKNRTKTKYIYIRFSVEVGNNLPRIHKTVDDWKLKIDKELITRLLIPNGCSYGGKKKKKNILKQIYGWYKIFHSSHQHLISSDRYNLQIS